MKPYEAARAQAVQMVSAGSSYHRASKAVGVCAASVKRWCHAAGLRSAGDGYAGRVQREVAQAATA